MNWKFWRKAEPERRVERKVRRRSSAYQADAGNFGSFPSTADTFQPPSSSIFRVLPKVRARSRWVVANTSMGASYLKLAKQQIIGTQGIGLMPKPTNKGFEIQESLAREISEAWIEWSNQPEQVDYLGQYDLESLIEVCISQFVQDGEALLRVRNGTPLRLEIIDSGRVPHWHTNWSGNESAETGFNMGVETDRNGRVLSWLVLPIRFESGASYYSAGINADQIPTRQMLAWINSDLPGQLRGLPLLTPVLEQVSSLGQYEAAALKHAQAGATRFGFVQGGMTGYQGDSDADGIDEADEDDDDEAVRGHIDTGEIRVEELAPGVEFKQYQSQYPDAQYAPFTDSMHKAIAAGTGAASHSLSGNLAGVSFSGGRLGENQQRAYFNRLRRRLNVKLITPLYRRWLSRSEFARGLSGQDFALVARHEYAPTHQAFIDPVKEAKSLEILLKNGLISRKQAILQSGRNPHVVDAEIADDDFELVQQTTTDDAGEESELDEV